MFKIVVMLSKGGCPKTMLSIKDALEVLEGKWKLLILFSLSGGPKRFKEISREVVGITDKTLSKELKHESVSKKNLEVNAEHIRMYVKGEKNILIVKGIRNKQSKLKMYNMRGENVFTTNFKGSKVNEITLPALGIGFYIVSLEVASKKMHMKIVLHY